MITTPAAALGAAAEVLRAVGWAASPHWLGDHP
jgi:hypothetical protein